LTCYETPLSAKLSTPLANLRQEEEEARTEMHEIIHLQFGPRSNHVGTHYWNIAESLFSYGDEDVDYGVVHDVDWRQGIGRDVSPWVPKERRRRKSVELGRFLPLTCLLFELDLSLTSLTLILISS